MMKTFKFCPDSLVPETLVRENAQVMSLGGWQFTARPTTPFQRRFKITLHGLRWYTYDDGRYDPVTDPDHNAHLLERFYAEHEMWKPFTWVHPHIGYAPIECRFQSLLNVPAAIPNSAGLIEPLEVNLIEHNPGF
jgi:hypothetical protein